VLGAARDVLAEHGLKRLTMRTLAQRLGVAPNSLYSHVPSKDALIDAILDEVLAEVDAPGPDMADPAAGLHQLMLSTYRVLLSQPDLVPLYLARQGARGQNAYRLGDVMLALLGRCGVVGPDAREALRVLIVFTIGFAAFATAAPDQPSADLPLAGEELFDNFSAGLTWLIAGITHG